MADLGDVTLDGRPLNSLRVADLKAALEERGLSKSGAKNALVKRLKGALMLENLERTSTPNTGLQPNSQIGEEMSQNSFIKQYLAKQQELLRQRLEREAREAVETDDQTDHTSVNNSVSCPAPAQIGEEMSQNSFIKQYLAKQQELLRQRLEREAREAVGTDDQADHTRTNHSVSCSGIAQDATPAVSVAQHKQFGPSDGAGLSGSANDGELNRNQEANMSSPPASAAPTCAPGLVAMRLASGDRVPPSSQVQGDSDDDEDWDSGLRRRSLGDPARRTTARKRSEASHQAPPHIPPLLSPQLCQPIPTTSPAPELSFPQPDTTKQSPPSPGMPPAWRQRASSTSSSGSSSSHSSSPEPQRSGQVQRKPGPLTLLARKLESEGAFSGAGWHSRDGNGEDSNIATVAPFPVRVPPEGVVSAITHTASMPFPMVPFHSQVPGSVHRANATEERVSRLEKEKALEKERLRALEVERQESQRILQEEQKREREEREALEQERIEQEKDLEREEKEMDLSDFDKGQIVMAIRLGQSISKTAGLVGCSRYAVVSTTKSGQRKKNNRRTGDRVFRKTRK